MGLNEAAHCSWRSKNNIEGMNQWQSNPWDIDPGPRQE